MLGVKDYNFRGLGLYYKGFRVDGAAMQHVGAQNKTLQRQRLRVASCVINVECQTTTKHLDTFRVRDAKRRELQRSELGIVSS